MVVINQNDWHRSTSGRAPQILAGVFVDVHGGKVSYHVSRARLSRLNRVPVFNVQHLPRVPHDDYGHELCRSLRHPQPYEEGWLKHSYCALPY